MELYDFIEKQACQGPAFISLTGGGGKTTLMAGLCAHLKRRGRRVLMTTTTKIMSPRVHDYGCDRVFCDDGVLDYFPEGPACVLYALENPQTNKWSCPPLENLSALRDRYDVIVNEADGSKRLPLKVHTQRDPVVPDFSTYTISVMGLWAIGKRTTEVAFGEQRDLVVDKAYLNWYVKDPEGLLKGSLEGRRMVVLNGSDLGYDRDMVASLSIPKDVVVIIASEKEGLLNERIQ